MNKQKKNGTRCHDLFLYFIFIFYLEPTVREQPDGNDSRQYYDNFFESDILKLCSKFFQSNYETLWQRHIKDTLFLKILQTWWINVGANYHLHNNPSLLFEEISPRHCFITACFFFSQINLVFKFSLVMIW